MRSEKPYAGAVLVAGGTGSRLKAGCNKARVMLAGLPLFMHSLKTLMAAPCVAEVCLVCHADDLDQLSRRLALAGPWPKPLCLAEGGAERQDSVRAGALALAGRHAVLLVHDSARPFASQQLVAACAKAARRGACAIAAAPVKDSIKRLRGSKVESLPRHELWAAQTPQALPLKAYLKASARAARRGWRFTDEAGLAGKAGIPVRLVKSGDENFKVTTPQDLALARQLLTGAKRKGGKG
jgi:2-C-methyl-D-erythritol 4-phosphate cytidylyltransferase